MDHDLDRVRVAPAGRQRLFRLVEPVGAGDQAIEVDPARRDERDRPGPGSGCTETSNRKGLQESSKLNWCWRQTVVAVVRPLIVESATSLIATGVTQY